MQVVLVMFKADGERRSFAIARDITVVGRREDCELRIPLTEVSRKHCRLIKDGDILRLEDLGSSNGTYHNGERIQEAVLQAGDTLQVGPVAFAVQIDGIPADDELQPATEAVSVDSQDTSVVASIPQPAEEQPVESIEELAGEPEASYAEESAPEEIQDAFTIQIEEETTETAEDDDVAFDIDQTEEPSKE